MNVGANALTAVADKAATGAANNGGSDDGNVKI